MRDGCVADRLAGPAQVLYSVPKLKRAKEVPSVKVPRVTAPNQNVPNLKGAIARVSGAKVPILELNT
jgi:hypothetical protein